MRDTINTKERISGERMWGERARAGGEKRGRENSSTVHRQNLVKRGSSFVIGRVLVSLWPPWTLNPGKHANRT